MSCWRLGLSAIELSISFSQTNYRYNLKNNSHTVTGIQDVAQDKLAVLVVWWVVEERHPSTTPSRCVFSRAACTRSLSFNCLLTVRQDRPPDFSLYDTAANSGSLTGVLALMHPFLDSDINLIFRWQGSKEPHSERETCG